MNRYVTNRDNETVSAAVAVKPSRRFAEDDRHDAASLPLPAAASGGSGRGNGSGWDGPPAKGNDDGGDLIYGGRDIADYLFPSEHDREKARRRVFRIADHYLKRKKPAGFLKLNGAICLSKSQWRKFHGLD